MPSSVNSSCLFLNYAATAEIYTLSLHDALPILVNQMLGMAEAEWMAWNGHEDLWHMDWRARQSMCNRSSWPDRKSTRLNSSHQIISYAVFCLKKKKGILDGLEEWLCDFAT